MPLWEPVTLADVQAVVSELDAARAELARVRESVASVLSSWDSGKIKVEPEGCCMCGSSPHGGHDGHNYYDMAEYYVGKAFDELRAELARMGEP